MSYSFSVRGATKAETMERVAAELANVVAAQPIHRVDEIQAVEAAHAFLEVIPSNIDGMDFCVWVSGSVGWTAGTADCVVTSAGVSVSASLVAAEKVAP